MKKTFSRLLFVVAVTVATASCSTYYHPSSLTYDNTQVKGSAPVSASMLQMLKPYSDSVNRNMNKVIGEVATDLEKKLPGSSLGYLMTDAIKAEAERIYGTKVDISLMNYGGIRMNLVPAGPLTLGKVYELMPFDNLLIIQKIPGQVLQQVLDKIAKRGGWPVSGATYTVKEQKAINVLINGQPLDTSSVYVVANSDYVANGGDDMDMLRTIPAENKGYLMRDAFINYFSAFTARGEKITAPTQNRVSYE